VTEPPVPPPEPPAAPEPPPAPAPEPPAADAIAAAREQGRAEAAREAGLRLAAAEFRAAAAGRIANPDAALGVLDMSKLVTDGEPDKDAIAALVDQLAAIPPAAPGRVPAGPRSAGPANGGGDWVREGAAAASARARP
jgi:hypothetical protein